LLNSETINQILALLEKGCSQRKTAELADVSVSTVQRIVNGTRSRTDSSSRVFTSLVNSDSSIRIPLELRGDVLRRYLDIRNQKLDGLSNS
jgi:transcriptional regulator with XRE-family HTH domain